MRKIIVLIGGLIALGIVLMAVLVNLGETNEWFLLSPIYYIVLCGTLYWVLVKLGWESGHGVGHKNIFRFILDYAKSISVFLACMAILAGSAVGILALLGYMR